MDSLATALPKEINRVRALQDTYKSMRGMPGVMVDILIADGDFTCLREGQECPVLSDGDEEENPLYIKCSQGDYWLFGQAEDGCYIGFTKK